MLGKKLSRSMENSALLGIAATASHKPNNQRRPDDKPRVWCDHCNKPHHTRETCWKLHKKPTDWKPVGWKTNKQGDSNRFPAKAHAAETPSLSKEQLDQLLQLLRRLLVLLQHLQLSQVVFHVHILFHYLHLGSQIQVPLTT